MGSELARPVSLSFYIVSNLLCRALSCCVMLNPMRPLYPHHLARARARMLSTHSLRLRRAHSC